MIKTGSGPPIPISESGRAGMGSGPPIPMKTSSGRPKTCSVKLQIRMKMSAKPIRTGQLMGTILPEQLDQGGNQYGAVVCR